MKKFILLFLLIPSLCFAVEPIDFSKSIAMSPAILGGSAGVAAAGTTAFCTAAATCTATNPGECDILCEDFEGIAECDADSSPDMDAACRNGYAVVVGTDATLDFTSTASGTYPCATTTNTNVLKMTHAATVTTSRVVLNSGSAQSIIHAQVYVRFNSEGILTGQSVIVMSGCADSGCSQPLWTVALYDIAGTLSLRANFRDATPAWTLLTGPNVSLNTWYRIQVKADKTNSLIDFKVDGTSYGTDGNEDSITWYDRNQQYFVLMVDNKATTEVEFDNWAVDNDTAQGACLN